jgi:hypothetical protein
MGALSNRDLCSGTTAEYPRGREKINPQQHFQKNLIFRTKAKKLGAPVHSQPAMSTPKNVAIRRNPSRLFATDCDISKSSKKPGVNYPQLAIPQRGRA